jgi:predicted nucleotidyltransferase
MGEEGARRVRPADPVARDFFRRLRETFGIDRLVLFGSRARGDDIAGSDYDFIVVSRAFEGVPFIRRIYMTADVWGRTENLEALCYTPEELDSKSKEIGVVREALREGVEIRA